MKLIFILINLLIITFLPVQTFAQIDTTLKEFYPLGPGDTWQYHNEYGEVSTYIQVVRVDTLLSNGYKYAEIGVPPYFNTGYDYERIDSLLRVQLNVPWGSDSCGGTAPEEISIYHLGDSIGSIWRDCMNWNGFLGQPLIKYNGIYPYPVFGEIRETMVFQFGYYDYQVEDTVFITQDLLVRGIGLFRREYYESGGYEQLTGAIVNEIPYGTIVSIDELSVSTPNKITLYQNYPNPFNPTTTIRYEISKRTNVSLKIFNILGQEIEVLVNEEQRAGQYEKQFNGAKLSSGVYIAVLQVSEAKLTKAMLLIK